MELHLVDLEHDLVAAWRKAFASMPDVVVNQADILAVASGAVVSPANGQGHMDGGIDRAYLTFFGPRLQRSVYEAVARRPEGRIPIGAAELVATGHARIQYVIVAPTMDVPELVGPANAYRAMRAALRVANREQLTQVYCPGLATGIGCVAPDEAAQAMAEAYRDWSLERAP